MLEEAHPSMGVQKEPLSHICSVELRKWNHCDLRFKTLGFELASPCYAI